jgi:hypothetical protein
MPRKHYQQLSWHLITSHPPEHSLRQQVIDGTSSEIGYPISADYFPRFMFAAGTIFDPQKPLEGLPRGLLLVFVRDLWFILNGLNSTS